MRDSTARIRTTRERLTAALKQLGYDVVPSQTNFVWATHPAGGHKARYEALKSKKILVRYMSFGDITWAADQSLDGLRITIGTDAEIDSLLMVLKEIG